jgi:NADPH-dependent curcumin reductase CurA
MKNNNLQEIISSFQETMLFCKKNSINGTIFSQDLNKVLRDFQGDLGETIEDFKLGKNESVYRKLNLNKKLINL